MGKILKIKLSDLIRRILLAWLMAATVEFLILPESARNLSDASGLVQMSLVRTALCTVGFAAVFQVLNLKARLERWLIFGSFAVLCALSLLSNFSKTFLAACLVCLGLFAVFAHFGAEEETPLPERKACSKLWLIPVVVVGAAFLALTIAWTTVRVCNFVASTYDFGIFTQMFHSMKTTGAPMTTLERSEMMSHFQVHVSPIFYLMLPFYWLFPSPVTLQVLQCVILASAVIPLWKIASVHGLSGFGRAGVSALLLLFPAYIGGVAFDLHENCFLTPLILWLFYAVDTKNPKLTVLFAALTLTVKEDAAVYVAVIGLWMFFKSTEKKDRLLAVGVFVGALIYFLAVTTYLSRFGQGVMSNRYDNFMFGGSSSLFTVVAAVFLSPMKAVFEIFSPKKIEYIFQTMLPLAFLPFVTRKYDRYILLVPYILVNLMPSYSEQHSIFFQYSFGSAAFLIYLTVINLADLQKLHVAVISLGILCALHIFKTDIWMIPSYLINHYSQAPAYHEQVKDALNSMDDDAQVASDLYYTPHLAQHRRLYDIDHCTEEQLFGSDYVVLQTDRQYSYVKFNSEPGVYDGFENLSKMLEEAGYDVFTEVEGVLVIYHRAS